MEEGLQAIQHGTPDQALLAAKRLGFNASSNVSGAQCLEEVGNVRAIMKVRNVMVTFPTLKWPTAPDSLSSH